MNKEEIKEIALGGIDARISELNERLQSTPSEPGNIWLQHNLMSRVDELLILRSAVLCNIENSPGI